MGKIQTTSRSKPMRSCANSWRASTADGIPTIVIDGTPEEQALLRLRYEIRRRVERIEITFNAEVLGGEQVGITPGKHTMVKVVFVNGAIKWAVIQGNRAVLLWA